MHSMMLAQNIWSSLKALVKTAFNAVCQESFAPDTRNLREHGYDESIYGHTARRLRSNLTFV